MVLGALMSGRRRSGTVVYPLALGGVSIVAIHHRLLLRQGLARHEERDARAVPRPAVAGVLSLVAFCP